MKSTPLNLCIFCNNPADTREHIPPKQLFKGKLDNNLMTVPSCINCNRSYQSDEDFFRQFWVSMLMSKSSQAKLLMDNELTRSIKRAPKLGWQMFKQMQLVDSYSRSGKYIGKFTLYHVSDRDIERINRVVEKIIKGLFYNKFNKIVPEDWIIKIQWITPEVEKDMSLIQLADTLKWEVIKKDTFAYGFNFVPETYQSVWILDFFKVPLFYVFVIDRETAREK